VAARPHLPVLPALPETPAPIFLLAEISPPTARPAVLHLHTTSAGLTLIPVADHVIDPLGLLPERLDTIPTTRTDNHDLVRRTALPELGLSLTNETLAQGLLAHDHSLSTPSKQQLAHPEHPTERPSKEQRLHTATRTRLPIVVISSQVWQRI